MVDGMVDDGNAVYREVGGSIGMLPRKQLEGFALAEI
jgi:hypothetical protein